MVKLGDKTDPHVVRDNIGRLSDEQGVIGQVVGDKVVVGTGELEGKGGLLVHIMVQEDVLPHTKTFPDSKMVKQGTLLHLANESIMNMAVITLQMLIKQCIAYFPITLQLLQFLLT